MTELATAALEYQKLGLKPIPCQTGGKRPLVEWKAFQYRAPTELEVRTWWETWPDANIALVFGGGTFAVDIDGNEGAKALEAKIGAGVLKAVEPPTSKTGKGWHLFFTAPIDVSDRVGLLPKVDVRGVGYVIAPPSLHESGARYTWVRPLRVPFPPAPTELLDLLFAEQPAFTGREQAPAGGIIARDDQATSWMLEAMAGVGEGQRNHTCAKLAGFFLGKGLDTKLVERILLQGFARLCVPPMPMTEVQATVRSIARREAVVGRVVDQPRADVGAITIAQAVDAWETTYKSGPPKFIPTPFRMLNLMLGGGFEAGQLIYLAARPGAGKTAFVLECCRHVAGLGHKSLVISREMLIAALVRRMVAQEARVDARSLKSQEVPIADLRDTLNKLRGLPIWLTDTALTLADITELTSRMVDSEGGLGFVAVDYLQLVRGPGGERRMEVEAVSQGLKTLATQCNVPVFCLSSLSRGAKQADGAEPRPTLDRLRDSGQLEHDADVVIFLHRPALDPSVPTILGTLTDVIVAKDRDGAVGDFQASFTPEYLTFEERYATH